LIGSTIETVVLGPLPSDPGNRRIGGVSRVNPRLIRAEAKLRRKADAAIEHEPPWNLVEFVALWGHYHFTRSASHRCAIPTITAYAAKKVLPEVTKEL